MGQRQGIARSVTCQWQRDTHPICVCLGWVAGLGYGAMVGGLCSPTPLMLPGLADSLNTSEPYFCLPVSAKLGRVAGRVGRCRLLLVFLALVLEAGVEPVGWGLCSSLPLPVTCLAGTGKQEQT